ncbi:hypothetical protein MY3957_005388 [Beauveria namnaoensis]
MQAPPTTTTTTPPIRQDGIPAKLVKPWTLPPQKTYVLHNANVVDAANGSIVPRQTVVLRDGLIDSVQPHAQLHPPHPPGVGRRHRGRSRRLLPLPGPHRLATCTSPPLAGSAALGFERGRHGRVLLFGSRFSASRLLSRGFTSAISQTGGHGDVRKAHDKNGGGGGGGGGGDCCQCGAQSSFISVVADGVPACLAATREQLRQGADFIKIMVGGGVASPTDRIENTQFTAAEVRAVADVADSYGTYVTAHAYTPRAIRHAVDNGVGGIEHGNLLDADTARYMAARKRLADADAHHLPGHGRAPVQRVSAAGEPGQEPAGARARRRGAAGGARRGRDHLPRLGPARAAVGGAVARVRPAQDGGGPPERRGAQGRHGPGSRRDVLVLKGNPLEDVGILDEPERSVLVVVKNGRVYTSRWSKMVEDVKSRGAMIE